MIGHSLGCIGDKGAVRRDGTVVRDGAAYYLTININISDGTVARDAMNPVSLKVTKF